MSHIADSRVPRGIGILPLQHADYDKPPDDGPKWSLDLRCSILATRVTGRDDYRKGGLGRWLLDEESVGDLNGGQLWNTRGIDFRKISMWRFATPVLTYLEGTPTASAGSGCATLTSFKLKPIKEEKYKLDDRFEPISPELFERDGKRAWPKFPVDWVGISLAADIENHQVDLFHPTDPRMVSVNRKGDAIMGSLVCDMGDGFKIDNDRTARLQSMMRVVVKPTYCGGGTTTADSLYNVIAWQIGPTGCKDTRGGYVFEKRVAASGGGGTPTPTLTTEAAPVITGVVPSTRLKSSHFTTIDYDNAIFGAGGVAFPFAGAPITAAELPPPPSAGSFAESKDGEGVIALVSHFDSGFVDVGDEKDQHQIGKDGDGHPINAAHLSTNAYFKRPGGFQDAPLEFGGYYVDPKRGRYLMPTYLRYDSRPNHPFVCGSRKGLWRWESECCIGKPDVPGFTFTQTVASDPQTTPFGGGGGGAGGGGGVTIDAPVTQWLPGKLQLYNASEVATGFGSILARPQSLVPNAPDLRYLNNLISPKAQRASDFTTPVTGRIEAFGYQRGGEWIYTQKPVAGRFGGGTSNGGFCLMPPEYDMADVADDFDRDDLTVSSTYFNAVPGAYWAAGIPDPTTGHINTGYRWGCNTDGKLTFATWDSGSTFSEVLELTQDGVMIGERPLDGDRFTFVGLIEVWVNSSASNVGGGEDTLRTYDLPANFLTDISGQQVNRGLRIKAWGTFAANGNAKTIKLYFGSTVMATNDVTANPNGGAWELDAMVFQGPTSTQQKAIGEGMCGAAPQSKQSTLPTEDATAAITLKVTGESGAAASADVTMLAWTIEVIN